MAIKINRGKTVIEVDSEQELSSVLEYLDNSKAKQVNNDIFKHTQEEFILVNKRIDDLANLFHKYLSIKTTVDNTYERLNKILTPTITDEFMRHLHLTLLDIKDDKYIFGRKPLPLRDIIFALTLKCYLNLSGRKMMFYINKAMKLGYISHKIAFASLFRYAKSEKICSHLQELLDVGINTNRELLKLLCQRVEQNIERGSNGKTAREDLDTQPNQ